MARTERRIDARIYKFSCPWRVQSESIATGERRRASVPRKIHTYTDINSAKGRRKLGGPSENRVRDSEWERNARTVGLGRGVRGGSVVGRSDGGSGRENLVGVPRQGTKTVISERTRSEGGLRWRWRRRWWGDDDGARFVGWPDTCSSSSVSSSPSVPGCA